MTDPQTPIALEYETPRPPSLGAQAARGAVWVTVPAVLAKLTGFAADIVLAWFLTPKDFGAVGLAVAVAAIFAMIQQAGLRDILTQRQKRFSRWSTPAFWLAATLGVICTIAMAAFAPVAARIWKSPVLSGLVTLMSVRCFLDAMAILPQAKLQIQLRYRAIGAVAAMCTLVQAGLSVILASKLFGWGPYAICVPMVITSTLQAAAFWWLARPSLRFTPQLTRWRWIGRDAGFAIAAGLVTIAVGYGDNAMLGLFQNEAVVGIYYFAYRLAVQANQLLVTNLSSVLFSALSQLHMNRQRQIEATMSAARLLAILAVPVNLLQAWAAEPLIRLIYAQRWEPAIVPFQILSVAMALALIGAPSTALLKAQGRFGVFFYWSAGISVIYLLLIGTGAALGGAVGVATAALVYYAIFGPLGLRLGMGAFPGFWKQMAEAFLVPLTLVGVAGTAAYSSRRLVPAVSASDMISAIWILSLTAALYGLLLRVLRPVRWLELMARLSTILHRRRA